MHSNRSDADRRPPVHPFVILSLALILPVLLVGAAWALYERRRRARRIRLAGRRSAIAVVRRAPVVLLQDDVVVLPDSSYEWEQGESVGLPASWEQDLEFRRN